jgi:RNA polymerase sigma-70 factor (ECF subfamily)
VGVSFGERRGTPERDAIVRTSTCELVLTPLGAPPGDAGPPAEVSEWVRRARAGDESAFALLVERHERMVLRTALRLLGNRDAARDAAQEAFFRLHRYLSRFDETRELGPWLYRVVVNVCRDLARRRGPVPLVALDDASAAARAATEDGFATLEEEIDRARQRSLVQAALRTLPEKERAAIVLRDIEGLPTADVARILGSSEGTVRSQISTGRLKIKRFVQARRGEGPRQGGSR